MTLAEIQYKAQSIMQEWKDNDSAPYVEFVEELALMNIEYPSEDLEKACDAYCKVCGHYHHTTPTYICRRSCNYFDDFKALLDARKED